MEVMDDFFEDDVDDEIDALFDEFCEGWRDEDVDGMVECYTEDCHLLVDDEQKILCGTGYLRNKFQKLLERYRNVNFKANHRSISGDTATEVGKVVFMVRGSCETRTGLYMVTTVKRHGRWFFFYDGCMMNM